MELNEDQQKTALVILAFIVLLALTSCSSTKGYRPPTRKSLKKSMQCSDWRYAHPKMETNLIQVYNPSN